MKPFNSILTEIGEPTISSYIISDKCYRCENQAKSAGMDKIYHSEYRVSGMCVKCQDHLIDNVPYEMDTSRFDHAREKLFQLGNHDSIMLWKNI